MGFEKSGNTFDTIASRLDDGFRSLPAEEEAFCGESMSFILPE